jgi:hypothetical protein
VTRAVISRPWSQHRGQPRQTRHEPRPDRDVLKWPRRGSELRWQQQRYVRGTGLRIFGERSVNNSSMAENSASVGSGPDSRTTPYLGCLWPRRWEPGRCTATLCGVCSDLLWPATPLCSRVRSVAVSKRQRGWWRGIVTMKPAGGLQRNAAAESIVRK